MRVTAHLEGTLAVITASGDLAPEDVPGVVAGFEALLDRSRVTAVVCDVARLTTPDLVAMDAIARLQLSARRRGCAFVVRSAPPQLAELMAFLGLSEVLAIERS